MARRYTREEFRERLNKVIESGHPFVIGSAGTGISARFEEEGGADAIGIYNSGRFRMDGLNSTCGQMFFSSANEEILKLAKRVMPVIKDVPVIAGIAGNDPSIEKTTFFEILKFYGFSAVMNFPTCGDFLGFMGDGPEALNEYGIGYQQEVEALSLAKSMGLFTLGYAFTEEEARMLGNAGIDVVICHMGLTVGGIGGPEQNDNRHSLDESVKLIKQFTAAAREKYPDTVIMSHGGPISSPEDTKYVYERTESVGFLGASSIERIPVEKPIMNCVRSFKEIDIRGGKK